MKLVLFGGIQGVGKTTLLSWLKKAFAGRIVVLDPGELFRRYVYNKKIKIAEEIEEYILETLLAVPDDSVAVLHWHYAVPRPDGYIPQISFSRLKHLAKSGKIEQVILVVIEASSNIVRKRRLADCQTKQRSVSRITIREEAEADENFLNKHKSLFSRALGHRNVIVFRVANINLASAKFDLYNFFQTLFN